MSENIKAKSIGAENIKVVGEIDAERKRDVQSMLVARTLYITANTLFNKISACCSAKYTVDGKENKFNEEDTKGIKYLFMHIYGDTVGKTTFLDTVDECLEKHHDTAEFYAMSDDDICREFFKNMPIKIDFNMEDIKNLYELALSMYLVKIMGLRPE